MKFDVKEMAQADTFTQKSFKMATFAAERL